MAVPELLITTSPERLSGTPVFAGTRVPVQTLLDYIEGGQPIDEFLADFPSVTRDHAIAVLELPSPDAARVVSAADWERKQETTSFRTGRSEEYAHSRITISC